MLEGKDMLMYVSLFYTQKEISYFFALNKQATC